MNVIWFLILFLVLCVRFKVLPINVRVALFRSKYMLSCFTRFDVLPQPRIKTNYLPRNLLLYVVPFKPYSCKLFISKKWVIQ